MSNHILKTKIITRKQMSQLAAPRTIITICTLAWIQFEKVISGCKCFLVAKISENIENIDPICYPLPVCIRFEGTDEGIFFSSSLYMYLAGPYIPRFLIC